MLNRPVPGWLLLTVVGVLSAGLAWKTLDPVYDPDTWWHLKVGQWVAEHQKVPQHDPFSRMSQETPTTWVAYSWLFEIALYGIDSATRHGVYIARAMLVGLSAASLIGFVVWRIGPTLLGLVTAVAAAATLLPLTSERPWHFTIAFTVITLAVVTSLREGGSLRRVWWLPVIFALWGNLHIQFVLGWGVLGLACLFPSRAKRLHAIGLTAACVATVLVNPYHVRLFGVVWEYATQAQALRLVRELQPPAWTDPSAWVVVVLLGIAFHRSAQARDGFAILLVAAGAFFALRMQRDMWFGTLAAAGVMGAGFRSHSTVIRSIGIVVLCFGATLLGSPISDGQQGRYPVDAVRYVREHSVQGPLFNHFDWGGYLIWVLPEYPVSIDGRTNLYGNDRVLRNYRTFTGEADWDDDPDMKSANVAILPANCPLAILMRGSTQWNVAYEDRTAVVFRR